MPFTGLPASDDGRLAAAPIGLGDPARTGHGVPKFKSKTPPSLPISPPPAAAAFSPSSCFVLPPGLNPSELLDSPVLLSASELLLSPTTGTFPIQNFTKNINSSDRSQLKDVKDEQNTFPEFSFQTQTSPLTSYGHQQWGYLEFLNPDFGSSDKANFEPELNSVQSFSPEISTIQTIDPNIEHNQHNLSSKDNQKSEDGYNWRKYGQKQVQGSGNPRSYYKCSYPNCPVKKKVERSLDGKITEIGIRGAHNHPKPPSTRRSSSSSSSASSLVIQSCSEQSNEISHGSNVMGRIDPYLGKPENSSVSNDDFEQSMSGCGAVDENEPVAKRWKGEKGSEYFSLMERRTAREPRVVVQTVSNVDIIDDGYRWRKYGQKVVKGNPNPRSYYKCTSRGCPVRKHVERAAQDFRSVITMYKGKHNHEVPPARSRKMPYITSNNSNVAMGPVGSQPLLHDSEIPATGDENSRTEDPKSSFASPLLEHGQEAPLSLERDELVDDMFIDSLLC